MDGTNPSLEQVVDEVLQVVLFTIPLLGIRAGRQHKVLPHVQDILQPHQAEPPEVPDEVLELLFGVVDGNEAILLHVGSDSSLEMGIAGVEAASGEDTTEGLGDTSLKVTVEELGRSNAPLLELEEHGLVGLGLLVGEEKVAAGNIDASESLGNDDEDLREESGLGNAERTITIP